MVEANDYMQQVMAEQADVEEQLKRGRKRKAAMRVSNKSPIMGVPQAAGDEAAAVDVRITGWWRWKNVIVPPNAYVVHTRRGRKVPLHCGLGTSFRFNPITDSYMVVPAAMQTIVINANSICREKQGVLVQGYVQWVIDEFETAYRKLDFSDPVDPMGVVNLQLREQAEAVIKDTVATMSLDNVLSDRQPIIKELTARLRRIMEGDGDAEEGLGLRIVTVQIKEAVISSASLWENLQRPFRAERRKEARLAELLQEEKIRAGEAEDEKAAAMLQIETAAQIATRSAAAESAAFDRAKAEEVRRSKLEAESLAQAIEAEKEKAAKRAELTRLTIENEIAANALRFAAEDDRARALIEIDGARRKVDNDLSPELLKQKLIEMMPELAERMPKPTEMKSVSINGVDGLSGLLPAMLELLGKVEQPKKKAA